MITDLNHDKNDDHELKTCVMFVLEVISQKLNESDALMQLLVHYLLHQPTTIITTLFTTFGFSLDFLQLLHWCPIKLGWCNLQP